MSVAKQLYQLQEVDLEIEANEKALSQATGQLGESPAVVTSRARLSAEHQHREELRRQQQSLEWEIGDLAGKLKTAEEELYSGRIRNPKELTNLQHDIDGLKAKRRQLEDKDLELMDQVERATGTIAATESELKTLEATWRQQQQQLSAQIEQLKAILSDLGQKRQQMVVGIDPQAIEIYAELRKRKGVAVARVEQGICRGCRISLPVSELQQVRSGRLVRCGSCGRILYLG